MVEVKGKGDKYGLPIIYDGEETNSRMEAGAFCILDEYVHACQVTTNLPLRSACVRAYNKRVLFPLLDIDVHHLGGVRWI